MYERLQREGIQFETVTAGKFKRTLTPMKRLTPRTWPRARRHRDAPVLFKLRRRAEAGADIDVVATGETWFGADALKRGLCDELKTTDDVLLDARRRRRDLLRRQTPVRPAAPGRRRREATR